jgi:hypothetical protein
MGWLMKYDVVIHCSKQSVFLTSLEGERFEFVVTLPSAANCVVNQLKADLIKDIRVVCEYPDVFPDDLPGVTPGLGKVTECIPYVRQDQVPHIQ